MDRLQEINRLWVVDLAGIQEFQLLQGGHFPLDFSDMTKSKTLSARILGFGLFKKVKVFSEWLKLHTTYSRLDYYNHQALGATECGIENTPRTKNITVSLTTYAHRIHNVHLVIESLLRQTVKPNNLVLWLSKHEFDDNTIPEILKLQKNRGLEVAFCEDLKSYKKIIPTLSRYPADILITADDDIIYPHDHIERLYRQYEQEPDVVHCNRAHLMVLAPNGTIAPYASWDKETSYDETSLLVFPTGCTGVLYTADSFDGEVNNITAFTELSPHADDVWLKLMSVRRGTRTRLVPHARPLHHYLKVPDLLGEGLLNINLEANDLQMQNVLARYPDIREKLAQARQ